MPGCKEHFETFIIEEMVKEIGQQRGALILSELDWSVPRKSGIRVQGEVVFSSQCSSSCCLNDSFGGIPDLPTTSGTGIPQDAAFHCGITEEMSFKTCPVGREDVKKGVPDTRSQTRTPEWFGTLKPIPFQPLPSTPPLSQAAPSQGHFQGRGSHTFICTEKYTWKSRCLQNWFFFGVPGNGCSAVAG